MARFHHTVTVLPVDRAWFEECAGLVLGVAESTRSRGSEIVFAGEPVVGLRLLKGRHLRPGARYEASASPDEGSGPAPAADDGNASATSAADANRSSTAPDDRTGGIRPRSAGRLTVTIREWRRGGAISVEQLMESDEFTGRLTVRLHNPDRPRALDVRMAVRDPDGGSLRRGSGRAKVDLAAWWAAAGIRPGAPPAARPPVVVRARHLLGRARLTLTPRASDEGGWRVDVSLTVRGRLLMRPVAALALFCCQVPLRRGFRSAADQAADQWNKALGEAPLPSADELRAEIVKGLTT